MNIHEHLVQLLLQKANEALQQLSTNPTYIHGVLNGYLNSTQIVKDLLGVDGSIGLIDPSNQFSGFKLYPNGFTANSNQTQQEEKSNEAK